MRHSAAAAVRRIGPVSHADAVRPEPRGLRGAWTLVVSAHAGMRWLRAGSRGATLTHVRRTSADLPLVGPTRAAGRSRFRRRHAALQDSDQAQSGAARAGGTAGRGWYGRNADGDAHAPQRRQGRVIVWDHTGHH